MNRGSYLRRAEPLRMCPKQCMQGLRWKALVAEIVIQVNGLR